MTLFRHSRHFVRNWYEIVQTGVEQEGAVLVNLDKQLQATYSQLLWEAKVLLCAPRWLKLLCAHWIKYSTIIY